VLLEALKYDNRIFGLDPQLVFQVAFQMLAIFILFLAASYLLLDPVRKILSDRKERVMKEQKEAKESREQAIRFKDEYDTKLKRIDKEAEQILRKAVICARTVRGKEHPDYARKKAMQRENEIIADARAEAARIMENAKREAELEKKRVKDEVKQEIISVAALMSEKIIAASVDEQTQNALFEQTLKEMGDKTWLNE
jgi:F-type H+-transporting ATPase subunit b